MKFDHKRLHVLRCYGRLPPLTGGMERHIAELTAAQRRLGVRVTNIYNAGHADGEEARILASVEIHRIRPTVLRELIFYVAAAFRMAKIAGDEVRVVHAHGGWSSFLFATILARAVNAQAIVVTLHAFMKPAPRLHRYAMKYCDVIFCTGLSEVRYLEDATRKLVHHLPSAPADQFFLATETIGDPSDIIVVANLVPRKNIELVLRCAFKRPSLRFSIFGDGPDRLKLESLRVSLGLDNVKFHGARSIKEIHEALNSSKLFLNVASSEGSPTAALEAMACGLPVVLTPSNDYSAILESGINGYACNSWNVDEIIECIDACLHDESRRREMGFAARKVAEHHRWDSKAQFVTNQMSNAVSRNQLLCAKNSV